MNSGEQGKLKSLCCDVYDGEVWKNFKWKDGHFFNLERRYGLMLNVDWFQPFKQRSDYSVGVIYFVIMNLPRSQRFKFENVILGGIIPSLESEPKLHTFLDPCVDELNGLWRGVLMSTSLSSAPLRVITALLCVAADIPATRKACGFVGHPANRACSKCFKLFTGGFGGKKDFSGFQDHLSWPKRDRVSYNRNCERLKAAKSQSEYGWLSRLYGVHYSALCAEGLIRATSPLSPGITDYFMCHKLTVNGTEREHYFACVWWFKRHPWNQCLGSFNTLCVWDANNFEPRALSYFLPIYRIHSLFTGAYLTLDNVKLMAFCPIPRRATILPASY